MKRIIDLELLKYTNIDEYIPFSFLEELNEEEFDINTIYCYNFTDNNGKLQHVEVLLIKDKGYESYVRFKNVNSSTTASEIEIYCNPCDRKVVIEEIAQDGRKTGSSLKINYKLKPKIKNGVKGFSAEFKFRDLKSENKQEDNIQREC